MPPLYELCQKRADEFSATIWRSDTEKYTLNNMCLHTMGRDRTISTAQYISAIQKELDSFRPPAGVYLSAFSEAVDESEFVSTWDPYVGVMTRFMARQNLCPRAFYDESSGEMVAHAAVYPWAEMAMGYVKPAWRGRGLLQHLGTAIALECMQNDFPFIFGYVAETNIASLKATAKSLMARYDYSTQMLFYDREMSAS